MTDAPSGARLSYFSVGCAVLLLAWAIVLAAAITGDTIGTPWQPLTGAALLILSSAGTIASALWLKVERGLRPPAERRPVERVIELFLLLFVVLGAAGAWSAILRSDVFRAIYVVVLLVALYIIKWPIERPKGVSVRIVSAWVFGAIAVSHIIRLLAQAPVRIGWWSVPEWISVLAVCLAAGLALWNWTDRGARIR